MPGENKIKIEYYTETQTEYVTHFESSAATRKLISLESLRLFLPGPHYNSSKNIEPFCFQTHFNYDFIHVFLNYFN